MYVSICVEKGQTVDEENAFCHAWYEVSKNLMKYHDMVRQFDLTRVSKEPEEREDFIEVFYSGNWIKEEPE